ncbi:MAG TPA: hypothetical protein VK400_19355 [Pyrinomonadaceae bacterium]|nr:hypothetical protein [Pyrinomonadaceae bacterium]
MRKPVPIFLFVIFSCVFSLAQDSQTKPAETSLNASPRCTKTEKPLTS